MRNAKLVLCGRSWISVSRCIHTHTIQNIIAHVHQTALIPSIANFYLIFRYCRYFATFYSRLNIFGGFNVGYAYKTVITRAICTYGNSYFIRIWHWCTTRFNYIQQCVAFLLFFFLFECVSFISIIFQIRISISMWQTITC